MRPRRPPRPAHRPKPWLMAAVLVVWGCAIWLGWWAFFAPLSEAARRGAG
ncbi:MAG: hypothetical protein ACKO5K_06515 [Armatimonadota bacterium]